MYKEKLSEQIELNKLLTQELIKKNEEIKLLKEKLNSPSAFDFYVDHGNKRKRGLEAEIQLLDIITGQTSYITIEAKSEAYKWIETGNLYVELEQKKKNDDDYHDSGLDATTANYWAHKLQYDNPNDFFVIIAPVEFLKRRLKVLNQQGHAPIKGKQRTFDGTATNGYAVDISKLFLNPKDNDTKR